MNLLRRAAAACDLLVVGVHTDDAVVAYKGLRPSNSQLERLRAVDQLGIADRVEIFRDRRSICRRYSVDVVFHGDDYEPGQYRAMWGEDLISELKLDVELLPHTPGVSSRKMREETPPIAWWLHTPYSEWPRTHIFDHMKNLYAELGGVWFASRRGRDLVREHFPKAACILVEDSLPTEMAAERLRDYAMSVIVTVSRDLAEMRPVLRSLGRPIDLIVLSHGRSGKKGCSADVSRSLGAHGKPLRDESLVIHDWSYDPECYMHLDAFLRNGGSFTNPVPETDRPRVLILPTWNRGGDKLGILRNRAWAEAFAPIAARCDLVLAPHPIADQADVQQFLQVSGARVLQTDGHSFEEVPSAHCVVCEQSGVLWESMLFDTPVLLAIPDSGCDWPQDLHPTCIETAAVIPFVRAGELAAAVTRAVGTRAPQQAKAAAVRLGTVDGKATDRVAGRIRRLLCEAGSAP